MNKLYPNKTHKDKKELARSIDLYRKVEMLRNYVADQEKKKWQARQLITQERVNVEIEIRHVICRLLQVKRTSVEGKSGSCAYSQGIKLARCTHCSTFMSIPDDTCPCCGWRLRRNHHHKSKQANWWQDQERSKHEID